MSLFSAGAAAAVPATGARGNPLPANWLRDYGAPPVPPAAAREGHDPVICSVLSRLAWLARRLAVHRALASPAMRG